MVHLRLALPLEDSALQRRASMVTTVREWLQQQWSSAHAMYPKLQQVVLAVVKIAELAPIAFSLQLGQSAAEECGYYPWNLRQQLASCPGSRHLTEVEVEQCVAAHPILVDFALRHGQVTDGALRELKVPRGARGGDTDTALTDADEKTLNQQRTVNMSHEESRERARAVLERRRRAAAPRPPDTRSAEEKKEQQKARAAAKRKKNKLEVRAAELAAARQTELEAQRARRGKPDAPRLHHPRPATCAEGHVQGSPAAYHCAACGDSFCAWQACPSLRQELGHVRQWLGCGHCDKWWCPLCVDPHNPSGRYQDVDEHERQCQDASSRAPSRRRRREEREPAAAAAAAAEPAE